MSETNVVAMPGVFRPDMEDKTPISDILTAAIDAPLHSVVVIGKVTGGGLYIASSESDADLVIAALMRAATYLASGEQVPAE